MAAKRRLASDPKPPAVSARGGNHAAPGGDPRVQRVLQLIDVMVEKGVVELEMSSGGEVLRLRLKEDQPAGYAAAPAPVPAPAAPAPAAAPAAPAAAAPAAAAAPRGNVFKSPMVGTFYRASAPDADPFVRVGDRVRPDTTLCIIEAMKVMNEIKAETEGEVVEILAQNGEPIEFGQPLFVLR
jgi:acetyl-CoA carboxylase biotin carboxyl carrier protein